MEAQLEQESATSAALLVISGKKHAGVSDDFCDTAISKRPRHLDNKERGVVMQKEGHQSQRFISVAIPADHYM